MKVVVYIDEFQIAKDDTSAVRYAISRGRVTAHELVLCASTVGLTHEDLGKLAEIVTSKAPLLTAELLGVTSLLGIR